MAKHSYSQDELLRINELDIVNHGRQSRPFTADEWQVLKDLNIARRTKRGYRGGIMRRKFNIQVVTNQRPSLPRIYPCPPSRRSENLILLTDNPVHRRSNQKEDDKHLRMCLWNARSMTSKVTQICDMILENDLDVLILTESWLRGDDNDHHIIADLKSTLPDYDILQEPRKTGRGGGICVIYRSSIKVVKNTCHRFDSFESLDMTVRTSSASVVRIYAIYRPPPSPQNKLTFLMFLREFSSLLEMISVIDHTPLILGDFNIHVDDRQDRDAEKLINALDSAGFLQHVSVPTHSAGHTLDLLITRKVDQLILDLESITGLSSDHDAILTSMNLERPVSSKKVVTCRKLRSINLEKFREDIKNYVLSKSCASNLSEAVDEYNNVLQDLLDKHAPAKLTRVSLRPRAPWYTEAVRRSKQKRRQAERKMVKTGLEIHKEIYRDACKQHDETLKKAKTDHLTAEIAGCDTKQLFRFVRRFSNPSRESILPDHDDDKELADRFGEFFHKKIQTIVNDVPGSLVEASMTSTLMHSFTEFEPVTENQVKMIIRQSPSKYCDLDPYQRGFVKACLDELLPHVTFES
nr:uncharacterized protein LOC129281089 [Lytechinus pictus]